jgi:LmbE family N-acetylglucosaminyl deacetylase
MKILYIFPHPDDESFGIGHAMHKQRRDGHEVYLFTLTKGGATKQRHKFGYDIETMGEVRYREMLEVEKALNLSGMRVIDLPDSGLSEMDPRKIEREIIAEIERIKPNVVVTYAVHGISGFHDHLVAHAVVKRAFIEMNERAPYLKRLAFYTITEETASQGKLFKLNFSKLDSIDCIVKVDDVDIEACRNALDCYVTFKETIDNSGIKDLITNEIAFEFYRENFDPPVNDIFAQLESDVP